jgi:hypothetical protein
VAQLAVDGGRLRLSSLGSLGSLASADERDVCLPFLAARIAASDRALWGIDAPLGLPVEVMGREAEWPAQLRLVEAWKGDAKSFGRHLAQKSLREHGALHIRRETDRAARTPFDCYHYRIIHQTFHAMRDVVRPVSSDPTTAVLPFQYARLDGARRVVVEACPSSTLLRLGLPRRGYKQPEGGLLRADRSEVRKRLLAGLAVHVDLTRGQRKTMAENPGGDAMDAVFAGVGAFQDFLRLDHDALASNARACCEGWVYA